MAGPVDLRARRAAATFEFGHDHCLDLEIKANEVYSLSSVFKKGSSPAAHSIVSNFAGPNVSQSILPIRDCGARAACAGSLAYYKAGICLSYLIISINCKRPRKKNAAPEARTHGESIDNANYSSYTLMIVYTISGIMAGIVMTSELNSGSGEFGDTWELNVSAAVIVGGTSLMGGQGKIIGTLIGCVIIEVINNGMNLMAISSNTQKVVLGLVILLAIIADKTKKGEIEIFQKKTKSA